MRVGRFNQPPSTRTSHKHRRRIPDNSQAGAVCAVAVEGGLSGEARTAVVPNGHLKEASKSAVAVCGARVGRGLRVAVRVSARPGANEGSRVAPRVSRVEGTAAEAIIWVSTGLPPPGGTRLQPPRRSLQGASGGGDYQARSGGAAAVAPLPALAYRCTRVPTDRSSGRPTAGPAAPAPCHCRVVQPGRLAAQRPAHPRAAGCY